MVTHNLWLLTFFFRRKKESPTLFRASPDKANRSEQTQTFHNPPIISLLKAILNCKANFKRSMRFAVPRQRTAYAKLGHQ